ncbi:hypothetical protein DM02DRAFT_89579 [Periconia macrospinosa]|uniref:Uncharacterized protein n=1 Tax=Periconia macrospinosa TaxID=97972 RepID=A0A2V1DJ94_9PLEO|nr:hypothetical protein DM02DRAFT_89579 [Periconia macrospinosa]
MMSSLMVALILTASAAALTLQNITLPLPQGTTNHATPGLLCTPAKWSDIITFYLVNYVAHAATVLTRPGERSADYLVSAIGSLLYPALGMFRGIEAILGGAIFARNDDLRKAARSGALCMVVRGKDWRPAYDEKAISTSWRLDTTHVSALKQPPIHVVIYSPPWLNSKFGLPHYVYRQIIHGRYTLPAGYQFAIVPSNTKFTTPTNACSTVELSATENVVKALIAIVQAGYAFSTLYRARGDQIEQFGFAAFGLTVAPYAVMSIINLIGNICQPDYASLYMVETSIMDEARRRGGIFEGAVARAQDPDTSVCACSVKDAEEAEQLRFSEDNNQSITATFTVVPNHIHTITYTLPGSSNRLSTSAHSHPSNSPQPSSPQPKTTFSSSPVPRTHPIKPLPPRQNYKGTEDDALLLVPCCDPLSRHTPPEPTSPPPPYHRISTITLRKLNPPFPRRTWCTHFLTSPSSPTHTALHQTLKYALTFLIALTPIFIIFALSHFSSGTYPKRDSTVWRNFVMQWLIVGVVSGISWVLDQEAKDASPVKTMQVGPLVRGLLYMLGAAPAVGGFVSVAQMLKGYGVCVWVGD